MLVRGFPAGSWQTNCYVVAPGPRQECVIVDPGQDSVRGIDQIVDEYGLQPVAVLLTHGHIDHIWSVAPVCGARDIPAYIHPDDRALLSDPMRGISAQSAPMIQGLEFTEPSDVVELTGTDDVSLAGMDFRVDVTPGHTPGSVTFRLGDVVFFSGDLIFQGAIGRTDLPGGSYDAILDSLARVVLPLPDELPILSGHGDVTTVGDERRTNPYLREAATRAGLPAAKGRGL